MLRLDAAIFLKRLPHGAAIGGACIVSGGTAPAIKILEQPASGFERRSIASPFFTAAAGIQHQQGRASALRVFVVTVLAWGHVGGVVESGMYQK
ncbi:MAG: hypothetical protein U1F63_09410 [Chitinivorax sp.]